MGASSRQFLEIRDTQSFEEFMSYPPVKKEKLSTAIDYKNKADKDFLKIRELEEEIKEAKRKALDIAFAFENEHNWPRRLVEAVLFSNMPWVYVSFTGEYRIFARYQGEEYHLKKCYKNPWFDWDSKEGETALYRVKQYNRRYHG